MLNKLRKEIYSACSSTGVDTYDYWKMDAKFPYFIINELVDFEVQYKTNEANTYSVDIHYFTKGKGKTDTLQKIEAVKEHLKSLEGVNATFDTRVLNEKEPNIQHGVLNFSIKYYT